jgi:hypothetical protein
MSRLSGKKWGCQSSSWRNHSGTRYPVPGTRYPTSGTRRPVPDFRYAVPVVRQSTELRALLDALYQAVKHHTYIYHFPDELREIRLDCHVQITRELRMSFDLRD